MASGGRNVESSRNAHQLLYPKPLAIHIAVVKNVRLFMETLKTFHHLMGTEFYVPFLDGCFLNLHELYVQVTNRGGYEKVVAYKQWMEVSTAFKYFSTVNSVSYALQKTYSTLLYHYEQVHFFRLREPSNNNSSGSKDNISLMIGVDAKFDNVGSRTLSNTSKCTPTYVASNSSLASMQPIDEAAIILSIAPPSSTTMYAPPTNASSLSLAPPSYTMMFSPPANVGSNTTMTTPSDNATSELLINASSLFIAPPSNTMAYVPPAIVARSFYKKRFNSTITTTSEPPTNTVMSAPLTNVATNSVATQSNTINLPEEHTEDPERQPRRSHRRQNRPKHPISGYSFFLAQKQSELRSLYPKATIGMITKMVGKAWASMSKEEKKVFENMGKADRKRYYKEKKEYLEQNNMNRV